MGAPVAVLPYCGGGLREGLGSLDIGRSGSGLGCAFDDVGVDAAISFAFSLSLESIAWAADTREHSVCEDYKYINCSRDRDTPI